MSFEFDEEEFERDVKIKVVGVGGGGGNAKLFFQGLHQIVQLENSHFLNLGNKFLVSHYG